MPWRNDGRGQNPTMRIQSSQVTARGRDWEAAQWGAPIKKEREQPLPAQEHFYGVCGAVWGSTAWRWVYPRQLKHSDQGHFPATPEVGMAQSHLAHRVSGSCAGAPFVGSEKKKKKRRLWTKGNQFQNPDGPKWILISAPGSSGGHRPGFVGTVWHRVRAETWLS